MVESPAALDDDLLVSNRRPHRLAAPDLVSVTLARASDCPDPAVWIHRLPAAALQEQAATLETRRTRGEALPLDGVSFALKDNIDVAGLPTTAACPAFAYSAARTATVVARLCEAGALLVGKTNLDQFAAGLAGDRSPYGVCRNPFDPEYISGGSSSGSAVAVARGLVSFALGTDTAGSGRVPAGCTNTVGLKPTPGLLSLEGVVPACRSLDCVSVFALTVEDARLVCETALGGALPGDAAGPETPSFAVPAELDFFGDEDQAALFQQTLARLEGLGWRRVAVDFGPLREVGNLLYEGPWLAERLSGIRDFLEKQGDKMFPVTRELIAGGAAYSAVDVFNGFRRLDELRPACQAIFERAEVLVVPTVPCLPRTADVQADSRGWSRRLGTYTNFVNLLRWCAVAVPVGFTQRGLPGGITLIGPGGADGRVCDLAAAWQRSAALPLGATRRPFPKVSRGAPRDIAPPAPGFVRVSVAGAHLHGQPLHPALKGFGARFVRVCRTAPRYRFVALMDLDPPRPGLLRDAERAGAVQVEIYDLPVAGFGGLVASVAPPLAIGTVELADGERVKGFLCESFAAAKARDITGFGGWVAFREQRNRLS